MLSNIGRAAIRRVGGGAGTSNSSTTRILHSIRRLQRVDRIGNIDSVSARTHFSLSFRQSYATATKATAKSTPKTKKATTSNVKGRKPAVKQAAKKLVAKKPKKKIAIKAKSKPKPKVKKVITSEQKARIELKALRVAALSPPAGKPSTAWLVLFSEMGSKSKGDGRSSPAIMKEAAEKYKSFSAQDLEEYNHRANENKIANGVALKQWTESHTPEEIRLANNARQLLKRKYPKAPRFNLLKDDRIPKRPRQPLSLFTIDRWASGDLKGIKVSEAGPLISNEFKALSDVERKVYEDRAAVDKQRYLQEFKTVYGRNSPLAA